MRQGELKFILQALAAGFIFILAVPLIMYCFSGKETAEGRDEDAAPAGFSGKISTPDTISVWLEEKETAVEVDFEEYVSLVTASEMPYTFEEEALKAQSVAARTYAMAKIQAFEEKKPDAHPAAPVCDTTHCQVYRTEKALIKAHEEGWEKEGWEKIQNACEATEGNLLYYDGKLVTQPLFFSSSGGQTENSEDVFVSAVPYLVSVTSPYEEDATHQNEEKVFELKDFAGKLKAAWPDRDFGEIRQDTVKILSRTAGGRVSEIQVGNGSSGVMKGTEVRMALGLSSALFSVSFRGEDEIVFTSSGSGHGVGLSQYGANGMAKEGYTYREILQHYYSGTEVI